MNVVSLLTRLGATFPVQSSRAESATVDWELIMSGDGCALALIIGIIYNLTALQLLTGKPKKHQLNEHI